MTASTPPGNGSPGDGSAEDGPAEPAVEWPAPGPGTWEYDGSHSPPGPTRFMRRVGSDSATTAYRGVFERFGGPLDTIEVSFVHGKMYRRLRPLIGGDRDAAPPPAPMLWMATRLHPAFRARNRAAVRTFRNQEFLGPIGEWERGERQQWIDRNLHFQDDHPATLDDTALADHVERIAAHTLAGWTRHHELHAADLGPIGDLLAHTTRWGLDPVAVMRSLAGSSPATVEATELLTRIAAALRDAGIDPAAITSLADVRTAGAEAEARLADYLRIFGWRMVTSYDLEGATLVELPSATCAAIRATATRGGDPEPGAADHSAAATSGEPTDPGAELAALRDRVRAADRPKFDVLLDAARRGYGLRDDNGPLLAEWPIGLVRRAYLEAGRRLAARSRIDRPELVFELDSDELAGLLRGAEQPAADELEQRAAHRQWEATLDAPVVLGRNDPPPSPTVLPKGLRRMVEAVMAATALLEPEGREGAREPLSGLGIGTERYVGMARVATTPEALLESMEPGDVLVAAWTAPTYNTVFAIAGGVIVQEGGLLCHAAVLSRELGIPAIIGCADALALIHDGDMVEIDPVAGQVRVLQPSPA